MDDTYLILEGDGPERRLHLAASNAERDELTSNLKGYRISPIFPVAGNNAPVPDVTGSLVVGCYSVDDPFVAIGTLIANAECDESRLWFTYGVPSILYFATSDTDITQTSSALTDVLRCVETWTVEGRTIKHSQLFASPPASFEAAHFQVIGCSATVEPDTAYIVTEIAHAMRSLVPLAAQFSPTLLPVYRAFTSEINKVVAQLNRFADSTRSNVTDEALGDRVIDQQRINVVTDLLVQINSMLAYGHTQAFGGASPILHNRSFVHSHSLFGIGTAVLAIHSVLAKVNEAFTEMPVSSIVRSFGAAGRVDVFRSLAHVNLADWAEMPAQVDHIHDNLPKPIGVERAPHLLFFSGRLGFQEAKHSISAALQAIPFGATIRWTPLTLSHEIMHAHVRDLLASLLVAHAEPGAVRHDFTELYEKHRAFVSRGIEPTSLREALCFGLLNYVRWRRAGANGNATDSRYHADDALLTEAESCRALKTYYKDMNEIIVHVLDFKYFYDSDRDLYTDYLWESWSTVPSVLADVEHYVLRSLAAVSITFSGTLDNRFRLARQYVTGRITALNAAKPSPLFAAVMRLLADEAALSRLTMISLANQYLAEITVHFLFSSHIASLLTSDRYLESAEEEPRYSLNAGEFPGEPIQSPIALLLDRIRRALRGTEEDDGLTDQFRAAWLYLACASFRP